MTRARRSGGVAAQPGNALAARLHRRIDLGAVGEARPAAIFSPVAGLKTSPPAAAVAGDALAVDVMADIGHEPPVC